MQRGFSYYLFIIVLLLLLFGVISFGDVLNIFLIIGGVILSLIVLGVLAFNIYINRLRKKAQDGFGDGSNGHSFFWTNRRADSGGNPSDKEGEVKIKMTSRGKKKQVGRDVGDYVDFEDVDKTGSASE